MLALAPFIIEASSPLPQCRGADPRDPPRAPSQLTDGAWGPQLCLLWPRLFPISAQLGPDRPHSEQRSPQHGRWQMRRPGQGRLLGKPAGDDTKCPQIDRSPLVCGSACYLLGLVLPVLWLMLLLLLRVCGGR